MKSEESNMLNGYPEERYSFWTYTYVWRQCGSLNGWLAMAEILKTFVPWISTVVTLRKVLAGALIVPGKPTILRYGYSV